MTQEKNKNNRKKILIVEDDLSVREIVGEIVSSDFQVAFASNGKHCLESVQKSVPDAILLDFKMPGMSGLDVCRSLRNHPQTRQIKVIMLSACNDIQTRIQLFNEGVVDFISKPFDPEELLVRLRSRFSDTSQLPPPRLELKALPPSASRVSWHGLSLDFSQRKIVYMESTYHLREIECKILFSLLGAQGDISSRKNIAQEVWGSGEDIDRNLDPHISSLRRTLKGLGFDIKAAYGLGYALVATSKLPKETNQELNQ